MVAPTMALPVLLVIVSVTLMVDAVRLKATVDVRHPVVVVGPLLGQTLEVMDKRWLNPCSPLRTAWETVWITQNPKSLLCGIEEQLYLTWNETTKLTSPPHEVEVRAADGWDGLTFAGTEVYGNLEKRLLKEGYVKDVDLLPQSYDWRQSVADWRQGAYPKMRKLIEGATERTGLKVVLTGISMAGPFTHGFLAWMHEEDATWANNYVHAWVPVASPWNGAVNALSALVGGALLSFSTSSKAFNQAMFVCPTCNPSLSEVTLSANVTSGFFKKMLGDMGAYLTDVIGDHVTQLIRTFPSIYWMSTGVDYSTDIPTDHNFLTLKHSSWTTDNTTEELVSASKMPVLFRKMGLEREAKLFEYAMSVGTTRDPGVPVHCVYSHNVQTFTHLSFPTSDDFSHGATIHVGDGDGTVHLEGSLDVCERWASTKRSYKIPGVAHASMTNIGQVLDVIVAVAMEKDDEWQGWQSPNFDELEILTGKAETFIGNLLERYE
jgi:hypothetical protein